MIQQKEQIVRIFTAITFLFAIKTVVVVYFEMQHPQAFGLDYLVRQISVLGLLGLLSSGLHHWFKTHPEI